MYLFPIALVTIAIAVGMGLSFSSRPEDAAFLTSLFLLGYAPIFVTHALVYRCRGVYLSAGALIIVVTLVQIACFTLVFSQTYGAPMTGIIITPLVIAFASLVLSGLGAVLIYSWSRSPAQSG